MQPCSGNLSFFGISWPQLCVGHAAWFKKLLCVERLAGENKSSSLQWLIPSDKIAYVLQYKFGLICTKACSLVVVNNVRDYHAGTTVFYGSEKKVVCN